MDMAPLARGIGLPESEAEQHRRVYWGGLSNTQRAFPANRHALSNWRLAVKNGYRLATAYRAEVLP